jgi:UDPglucose--hexose-1-phosphate uridylyltransferase
MESEIRKDYFRERYVLISPKRGKRPHENKEKIQPISPPAHDCHFCPAGVNYAEEKDRIGGDGESWQVLSLLNKFPAVSLDNPKAYGSQEVIIDTPEHTPTFEEFTPQQVVRVLQMYQRRIIALSQIPKIEYILTFKNQGGRAGASIAHSHSQIFATEFLPPQIFDTSRRAHEYRISHGTCVYCDVLGQERHTPRWIWGDEHVGVFAPYASMHNYEAWILPLRHVDNLAECNQDEVRSLAVAMQRVVTGIVGLDLPYNFYCHQVIHDEDQHVYIKVVPRGSIWAGVEVGSGLIINAIPPEDAASYYREQWNS